jgi:hypothetical protein
MKFSLVLTLYLNSVFILNAYLFIAENLLPLYLNQQSVDNMFISCTIMLDYACPLYLNHGLGEDILYFEVMTKQGWTDAFIWVDAA